MRSGYGLPKRISAIALGFGLAAFRLILPLSSESLWEPSFSGYVSPSGSIEVGDLILVEISPQTELKLDSSHIDSEQARLSFSGGEGGGLFDFLPQGSSSSERSIEEDDSYALSTRMAVQVLSKEENGLIRLRGERSVEINGVREEITLSAFVSPRQIRSGEVLSFDQLSNAELSYSGVGYGARPLLSSDDLEEGPPKPEPVEPEIEVPETAGEDAAAAELRAPAGEASAGGYSLSEERRRELLLSYFNRFLDMLFSQ
jgi:flagellar L-ring protein FlgH